jgi:hypothetical protein
MVSLWERYIAVCQCVHVINVTVLDPLLFLTYINDMPSHTESDVRLFADDSLLYREIRNINDSIQLQEDLNALEGWEMKWLALVRLGCHKTEVSTIVLNVGLCTFLLLRLF